MNKQVKVLAAHHDVLSVVPGTRMMERDSHLL